jgi:hypothetical protein
MQKREKGQHIKVVFLDYCIVSLLFSSLFFLYFFIFFSPFCILKDNLVN